MADVNNLAFHRKYRPNTLQGYIGNTKLKESAMRQLSSGKRPQVILMYGDSGCGKTTFARLLAKEYSCEDRDNTVGACGKCPYCTAVDDYIATGSTDLLTNIHEIDITDQSGKNDLGDVLQDMAMASYGDEWKIYIFDECHKASDGLQNRLLKIAEEPPENVLMVFCTTNPEKLIETLKNRCQLHLHVKKPSVKELSGLLKKVCDVEDVPYDRAGLEFIANRGELTIRTALQNLQQVVTELNSAEYSSAVEVFESVSQDLIIDIFRKLKNEDVLGYVSLLNDVKSKMEFTAFLTELRNFVKRGIYTINGINQDGVAAGEIKLYKQLFFDLGINEISYLLHRLLTLDTRNLEMELLLLGYSGLKPPTLQHTEEEKEVLAITDELKAEEAQAAKIVKTKEKLDREQQINNVSNLTRPLTIEDLLEGGGILVDN